MALFLGKDTSICESIQPVGTGAIINPASFYENTPDDPLFWFWEHYPGLSEAHLKEAGDVRAALEYLKIEIARLKHRGKSGK